MADEMTVEKLDELQRKYEARSLKLLDFSGESWSEIPISGQLPALIALAREALAGRQELARLDQLIRSEMTSSNASLRKWMSRSARAEAEIEKMLQVRFRVSKALTSKRGYEEATTELLEALAALAAYNAGKTEGTR